jgi:hypothetical protein
MVADDNRFAPADSISWNDAGDELTLFDSSSGSYFALNGPAVAIWRELAAGARIGDAVETLAARFDCPRDAIANDVVTFVRAASERNLIVMRE